MRKAAWGFPGGFGDCCYGDVYGVLRGARQFFFKP